MFVTCLVKLCAELLTSIAELGIL